MLVLVDVLCAVGVAFAAFRNTKALRRDERMPSVAATALLQFWIMFSVVQFMGAYFT